MIEKMAGMGRRKGKRGNRTEDVRRRTERRRKMIRIICDRCGSTIETKSDIGYIAWNFRRGQDGNLAGENKFEGCHFCRDCMKEIRAFIQERKRPDTERKEPEASKEDGRAEPEKQDPVTGDGKNVIKEAKSVSKTGQTVTKEDKSVSKTGQTVTKEAGNVSETKKEKKRKTIDIGRVMALKKAGWTNAQIADDIGVETSSVAGAIRRYRKKNGDGSSLADRET